MFVYDNKIPFEAFLVLNKIEEHCNDDYEYIDLHLEEITLNHFDMILKQVREIIPLQKDLLEKYHIRIDKGNFKENIITIIFSKQLHTSYKNITDNRF